MAVLHGTHLQGAQVVLALLALRRDREEVGAVLDALFIEDTPPTSFSPILPTPGSREVTERH